MLKPNFEFVWHPPAPEPEGGALSFNMLAVADGAGAVIPPQDRGYVEVRNALTPREELVALLTLGAEVEHALLVQYLYAAASLDPDGNANTQQLRETLRTIAIQEMAHLVSVQNLLLAVGGPECLHIGRDTVRAKSRNNPMPFALEPITDLTLSEYILVEAPAVIADQAIGDRVEGMKLRVKKQAGIEPIRVGALYTQIYWLFQPTDSPSGKLSLTPDESRGRKPGWHLKPEDFTDPRIIAAHQAQFGEWRGNNARDLMILPLGDEHTLPADLTGIALDNVYAIMEQGEGEAPGENTHFERFLAALDLYAQGGLSLLPLPRTPYAEPRPPEEAPVTTALKEPYTSLWASLLDVRYTMLLLDIGAALATPVSDTDRQLLVTWAFSGMRPLLLQLITQLSSQTLRAIEPCGPTFGLLYEDLPGIPADRWTRYQTLLRKEAEVVAGLEIRTELKDDLDGQDLLDKLKTNSTQRLEFITQKLGGPTPPPAG